MSLVWALRRTVGGPAAALLATVLLLAAGTPDVPIALTAIWCLVALSSNPPTFIWWLLPVGGAVLGAIETLVELRSGPVIWAACSITLIARRDRRTLVPTFIGLSVTAFAAAWFAAGQSLGNLPSFVRNGWQIVSGYGEAMGLSGTTTLSKLGVPAIIVVGIGLVIAAMVTSERQRARRLGAAFAVGVIVFALYKEAVVRGESHHEMIFFTTAAVICAALAYGRRRVIAAASVLAASAIAFLSVPGDVPQSISPFAHAKQTVDEVRLLFRRTFLYTAKFRYATVNDAAQYRVVPGTAADGMLLEAPPGVDYPAPFSLNPAVRTIRFTGSSGSLRVRIYWMPVRR